MKVYLVFFCGYDPPEWPGDGYACGVDSVWDTHEAAQDRAGDLGKPWCVAVYRVNGPGLAGICGGNA